MFSHDTVTVFIWRGVCNVAAARGFISVAFLYETFAENPAGKNRLFVGLTHTSLIFTRHSSYSYDSITIAV